MQLCAFCKKEEGFAIVTLSKEMGTLMTCMSGCLSIAEVEKLIGYYIDLARRGIDIKKLSYNNDISQVIHTAGLLLSLKDTMNLQNTKVIPKNIAHTLECC